MHEALVHALSNQAIRNDVVTKFLVIPDHTFTRPRRYAPHLNDTSLRHNFVWQMRINKQLKQFYYKRFNQLFIIIICLGIFTPGVQVLDHCDPP